MANEPDSSDILGSSTPIGRGRASSSFLPSSTFFLGFLTVVGIGFYFWFRSRGHVYWARWKERRRRRAARARYGIPANDPQAFAVAYAKLRRQQDSLRVRQDRSVDSSRVPEYAGYERQQLRQRTTGPFYARHDSQRSSPRDFTMSSYQSFAPSPAPTYFAAAVEQDEVPEAYQEVEAEEESPAPASPVSEDGNDSGFAEEEGSPGPMEDVIEHEARRPKRLADSDEEDDVVSMQGRRHDKRRRKTSSRLSTAPPIAIIPSAADVEEMDVDQVHEMPVVHRGKKRDRVEAGSTFGGDDESVADDAIGHRTQARRRRKMRKSSMSHRGRKRGRGVDSSESESEEGHRRIVGKASKRRHDRHEHSADDVSTNDTPVIIDPRCGNRKIGDEWDAPGARFKVGENGQRLVQATVLVPTPRYPMPRDSKHPHRAMNVDAYQVKWLTDEEFQAAKQRGELSSQRGQPSDLSASTTSFDSLWKSTSRPGTPTQRLSFDGPTLSNSNLRAYQAPTSPHRRRLSSFGSNSSEGALVPKLLHSRSLTKWQKQEMEASSLDRIKAKAEAERARKEALKLAESSPLTTAPPTMSSPPVPQTGELTSAPSASNSAPQKTAEQTLSGSSNSIFAFPGAPASQTKPAAAEDKAKSQSVPTPVTFSFGPSHSPAQSSSTAPAASSSASSGIPNFFAPKTATPVAAPAQSVSATSAPLEKSSLGPAPAPASSTPALFSFGAPKPVVSSPAVPVTVKTEENKLAPGLPAFSSTRPGPSPLAQSPASAPAVQTNTNGTSSFTFAKLADTKPVVTSAAAIPTPSSTSAAGASSDATKPKFSFGVAKSSNATPAAAPSTTQDNAPKFSFGPFGAGTKDSSSSTSTPANPFATFGAPKAPGANKSPFASAAGDKPETNKFAPTFGMPGGTTASPFSFGATTTSAPSSSSAKPSPSFGAPSMPTSANAGAKPTYSFAPLSTAAAGSASGEAPKPTMGGFSFNFGGSHASAANAQANASAPTSTPTPPSLFGAPSGTTPSAFSYGSGNSSTFSFGAKK